MNQIDHIDRKILHELDLDSRQSLAQLSRRLRMNRATLNFRINRLKSGGIIRNFVTLVRPSTLGFIPFKMYLRMQNFSQKEEHELKEYIKTIPSHWAAKVSGGWDFIIGIMAHSPREFKSIEAKLSQKFGQNISSRSDSTITEITHFNRDYLVQKEHTSTHFWVGDYNDKNLSPQDILLLKLLSLNSRISIVELFSKTRLDPKTIISKLRKFKKEGIVYMHNISLNLPVLGYNSYKGLLSFRVFDEPMRRKLVSYCKTRSNIINVIECVGDWDIEIDFELPTVNRFYREMKLLRDLFSDSILKAETVLIEEEYGYTTIPEGYKIEK